MAQDKRVSSLPQPFLEEIIRIVKETMVDEAILARASTPDGYQKDPNIGSGSITVVNDVTTGGVAAALSAEQGKLLATAKADKLSTVSVSAAGNFDLTEAAHNGRRVIAAVSGVVFTKTTVWSADAVGCFLDVDADGAFTLGTGIAVPAGCAAGSADAAGNAVDLACVDGILSSKTPAIQINTSSVGTIAPSAFAVVPVSTTNGVLATITVPPGTLGARGLLKVLSEFLKSGTTDAGQFRVRIGATADASPGTTEIVLANGAAASTVMATSVHIRANGANLTVAKINALTGAVASATTVAINQSAGFVIYICATTLTTDTVSLIGAHAEFAKVA